jgi:hypothetical protein
MANPEHLAKLKEGVKPWNRWRKLNPEIVPEFRSGRLSEEELSHANLTKAFLLGADLSEANLSYADLSGANLSGANLSGANLGGATLVRTNLDGANLTACRVYGISAWDVRLEGAIQSNLVITPVNQSPIRVDNLEVAQFIYPLKIFFGSHPARCNAFNCMSGFWSMVEMRA